MVEFCLVFFDNQPIEIPKKQFSEIELENKSIYLQKLFIDDININLDYVPHKLSGNLSGANLLNFFQLENFKILLPKISIKSAKNFQQAIVQAWNFWLKKLKEKELIKFITGIGPLATIKNIGSALYEIAKLPYNPHSDGTKQALLGLIRAVFVESLRLAETFIGGAYSLIQAMGFIAGIDLPSRKLLISPMKKY